MQSKTSQIFVLSIAAMIVLVAAPYTTDDAFATKPSDDKGRLHVTIPLGDKTIPAGDFMLLMDTTPDKITQGHLAIKAPCDNPVGKVVVVTGIGSNLKLTNLNSNNIVNPLSTEDTCLYHMDLPIRQAGITDVAIENTGTAAVNFGPADTVTIYASSFKKMKEDHHETTAKKSAHDYVETIEHLLQEAKSAYSQGNSQKALDLATTAYLDNYEFIESKVDAHSHETNEEIEHKLREQLRSMIKEGAPVSDVNSHINDILIMIEDIEGIFEDEEEKHMEHREKMESKEEKTGHEYVENIEHLLQEVKRAYSQGNSENALKLAQEAYLDNYEFIEDKVDEHDHEKNEEVEHMLKEELRMLIRDGAPASQVSAHVNDLLIQIEDIEGLFEEDKEKSMDQKMESSMQKSAEQKQMKDVPEEARPQVKVNAVTPTSAGYKVTFTVKSGDVQVSNVKVVITSDKDENTTTISGMQARTSSLSTAIVSAKDPSSVSASIVEFDLEKKFRTNIGGG